MLGGPEEKTVCHTSARFHVIILITCSDAAFWTTEEHYFWALPFRQCQPKNMDQYLNRLRKLASTCAYGALCDELIRDRLVIGIKSHEVRERLLREKALTLNTALDIIRAAETASDQLKKIDGEIETSAHDESKRWNSVNIVERTTIYASVRLMGKNAASVTWRTILLRCAEVEIKNLKGEHRNLWRAFPRNLRGVFIELKKPNQQSLMMKFTTCSQSSTAAVLNTRLNLR